MTTDELENVPSTTAKFVINLRVLVDLLHEVDTSVSKPFFWGYTY